MSSEAKLLNKTQVIACQLIGSISLLAHFGFAKVSVNLALAAPKMRWAHIIALAASF